MEPMPMSVAKQMKPEGFKRLDWKKKILLILAMELLLPNFYKSTYAVRRMADGVNRAFKHVK
jgi:hypothetical protein